MGSHLRLLDTSAKRPGQIHACSARDVQQVMAATYIYMISASRLSDVSKIPKISLLFGKPWEGAQQYCRRYQGRPPKTTSSVTQKKNHSASVNDACFGGPFKFSSRVECACILSLALCIFLLLRPISSSSSLRMPLLLYSGSSSEGSAASSASSSSDGDSSLISLNEILTVEAMRDWRLLVPNLDSDAQSDIPLPHDEYVEPPGLIPFCSQSSPS